MNVLLLLPGVRFSFFFFYYFIFPDNTRDILEAASTESLRRSRDLINWERILCLGDSSVRKSGICFVNGGPNTRCLFCSYFFGI